MSVHAANTTNANITDFNAAPGISGTYTEVPVTKNGIRVKTNNSSVYIYLTAADYSCVCSDLGTERYQLVNCCGKQNLQQKRSLHCPGYSFSRYSVCCQEPDP